MRLLGVFCVAVLLLLASDMVNSREYNGTLKGVVLLADGAPATGARVIEEEDGNGAHPHAMLTGADGRFTFSRVSPGAYRLRAYYHNTWSEWEKQQRVKAGKETDVTLRLP